MTKVIANVAMLVAALALMLGNYWFTFGLWPKSWLAFFGFGMAAIVLALLQEMVKHER